MTYVAKCVEHREKFVIFFKTRETDKAKLLSMGHELASQWGAQCNSVSKWTPRTTVTIHDSKKKTDVATDKKTWDSWVKKQVNAGLPKSEIDARYTIIREETEPEPGDVWDCDISADENMEKHRETATKNG